MAGVSAFGAGPGAPLIPSMQSDWILSRAYRSDKLVVCTPTVPRELNGASRVLLTYWSDWYTAPRFCSWNTSSAPCPQAMRCAALARDCGAEPAQPANISMPPSKPTWAIEMERRVTWILLDIAA